jgi:hypothetical protein
MKLQREHFTSVRTHLVYLDEVKELQAELDRIRPAATSALRLLGMVERHELLGEHMGEVCSTHYNLAAELLKTKE